MCLSIRALAVGAGLLPGAWAGAGPITSAAGHWDGAIHAPTEDVVVSVDLAADDSGKLGGTFSNPGQKLNGFPLWSASIDGEAVKLELKTGGRGVQTFEGRLSADGQTITGQFLIDVHAVPFTLRRAGEAQIAPPLRSPAIDAKIAGSWVGSLDASGQSVPLALTLTNHADRTSTGTWTTGGGPPAPVAIVAENATVTLTSPIAPAVFTGTLSADGSQLSGKLEEAATSRPVVFTRASSGR